MDSPDWSSLSDDELLEKKISQLGLKLEGSKLQPLIQQLYDELSQKGLTFHPPCHIGDEWFVPVGIPAIFVPFFLTHDRLRQLERKIILEVEGETPEWFMKLIRHEAAHAYAYAFPFVRKRKWQRIFGKSSNEETPSYYRPRPYSRSFVVHLDDWYAQSHPDEDFAETFAVWLSPDLDWRRRYRGWPALRKLEYVDELMKTLAGRPPVHQPAFKAADYDCLSIKLKTYYKRKRKQYEESFTEFYEKDLRRLFPAGADTADAEKASRYLRRHRQAILRAVTEWTHERKYRVNQLVDEFIRRCDILDLWVGQRDAALPMRLASYITTMIMNHLFTGRFKRTK